MAQNDWLVQLNSALLNSKQIIVITFMAIIDLINSYNYWLFHDYEVYEVVEVISVSFNTIGAQ